MALWFDSRCTAKPFATTNAFAVIIHSSDRNCIPFSLTLIVLKLDLTLFCFCGPLWPSCPKRKHRHLTGGSRYRGRSSNKRGLPVPLGVLLSGTEWKEPCVAPWQSSRWNMSGAGSPSVLPPKYQPTPLWCCCWLCSRTQTCNSDDDTCPDFHIYT